MRKRTFWKVVVVTQYTQACMDIMDIPSMCNVIIRIHRYFKMCSRFLFKMNYTHAYYASVYFQSIDRM